MTSHTTPNKALAGRRTIDRRSVRLFLLALSLAVTASALVPGIGLATPTRIFESSFGSFTADAPNVIAVDQSNGDVYVGENYFSQHVISRFDSTGAPKDFTAGPDAGTNTLTGFGGGAIETGPTAIAIDNSGGPLDGTIYVADGGLGGAVNNSAVKAFSSSGASLGEITEAGAKAVGADAEEGAPPNRLYNPCGIAVDQSNGSLYVAERQSFQPEAHIWRYAPTSPSGPIDRADYTLTGITAPNRCSLAADSGHVYAASIEDFSLGRYAADDFTASFSAAASTQLSTNVTSVSIDPGNGDVYADEGFRVRVFDESGQFRYRFGFAAQFGVRSSGLAVKSAASGPATNAYIADPANAEVDVFGSVTDAPNYTHPEVAAFGEDGSGGSAFDFTASLPGATFDQAARRFYALGKSELYGFNAMSPPAFSPLAGFAPLAVPGSGNQPAGVAVDNSASGSAGNVYVASPVTDLIYGFDASGGPLGGAFPIDPAVIPGAPAGSPKKLCGAAVDSAGSLWVSNSSTQRILEYSSTGASLPGTIDASVVSSPCGITFDSNDNLYVANSSEGGTSRGVWRYTAASGYSVATRIDSLYPNGIVIDRSSDHLFVTHRAFSATKTVGWIDEYDASGDLVDEFLGDFSSKPFGVAVDETNHHLYVADLSQSKVRVFGPGVLLPETEIGQAFSLTNSSATLSGSVNTQGIVPTDCHFEYVTAEAFRLSGFTDLSSGGTATCSEALGSIPVDFEKHPVSAPVSGLAKYTDYRFRLVVSNADGAGKSDTGSLTTASPPGVEIAGAPNRTATTAELNGRVNPRSSATSFHFEYGDQGPCDSNPCTTTADLSAGSSNEIGLVATRIEGLRPNTTYHYRLLAENGNPDGVSASADQTVTTRASDATLSHGHFRGPSGSDRAWEQVSLPDSSGNPVGLGLGFSTDGNRALYSINGGSPSTDNGSLGNRLFAERTVDGWRSSQITPPRTETIGVAWALTATSDLSTILAANYSSNETTDLAIWRLSHNATPTRLFLAVPPQSRKESAVFGISADGSRELMHLDKGTADPAYPEAATAGNLFDVSSGPAHLVSLLPGDVPACVGPAEVAENSAHWISTDGSRVYFPSRGTAAGGCAGPSGLYMRDIEAGQSTLLSGPVLSGPDCGGTFVRSTADAVFFWTRSRLVAEDTTAGTCPSTPLGGESGDLYRYDLGDGSLSCVTCVASLDADLYADVGGGALIPRVAVAPDGSRAYFQTGAPLLPGAPAAGESAVYRVDVASGELAYVAPLRANDQVSQTGGRGNALSADGSVFVFRSNSPKLNPVGGPSNDGDFQYYRYDDEDRSLVCISCPPGGSSAEGVPAPLVQVGNADLSLTGASEDGSTIAFISSNPLLGGDQNTPGPGSNPAGGQDVYEWRDGRILLVTDGLTNWPANGSAFEGPKLSGVSRSGKDVYFTAPVQYTADALDGYRRLYDARIGGGIEFAPPPKPCPLEVCQGTPKGAPEERAPGTGSFSGIGNKAKAPASRCGKNQRSVRRKGNARCVAKHKKQKRRAKGSAKHKTTDNRRSAR